MATERTRSEEGDRRPYAAAANVTAVVDRVRRINLPDKVNSEFLEVVGVPEVSRGRVIEALRFLGFIDDGGRPTDVLRSLAGAHDDEVRDLLAAAIREAYAEDFTRVDPSQDPQPRIIAAFRRYQPRSQSPRMVMLFLGLCRYAGIPVLDAPRERQMAGSRSNSRPRAASGNGTEPNRKVGRPSGVAKVAGPIAPNQVDPIQAQPGLLFGVTVEDVGALSDEQFPEVWSALGIIARARAKSLKAAREADQATRRREDEAEAQEEAESVE